MQHAQTHDALSFSVVMPAFNAAATIGEAIASVVAQTWAAWELVIIDDGSTDRTRAAAESWAAADARITVIHQQNAGPAAARRVGVDAGTAPLIVRLDADDLLLPHCLATYARFIEKDAAHDIYSCNGEVFTADGVLQRYYASARFQAVTELTLEEMLVANLILGPAAVCTREAYVRAGGMRPGVYVEDYDFWLRALAAGARHVYLPDVLVRYRRHRGQMTTAVGRVLESVAEALEHLASSGVLDARLTAKARASAFGYAAAAQRAAEPPDAGAPRAGAGT